MDSDHGLISSPEVNSSGNGETDHMLSPATKHKTNCMGNEVDEPSDVEILINGLSSDQPGNQEQQQQQPAVTPEMLYKLSKKIAQLTKVLKYFS